MPMRSPSKCPGIAWLSDGQRYAVMRGFTALHPDHYPDLKGIREAEFIFFHINLS